MSKIEIVKPSDAIRSYKVCIFGEPGSGKTILAAGAPDPIIVDFEDGSKTLCQFYPDARIVPATTHDVPSELFWAIKKKEVECQTVVFDSISAWQDLLLRTAVDAFAKKENRAKDALGTTIIPYLSDYRYPYEYISRVLGWYVNELSVNIVVIAHTQIDEEKTSDVKYARPAMPPKLYNAVNQMMDLVAYVNGKFQNNVFTQTVTVLPTGAIRAKNRLYNKTAKLINPTWNQLVGKE